MFERNLSSRSMFSMHEAVACIPNSRGKERREGKKKEKGLEGAGREDEGKARSDLLKALFIRVQH